MKHLSVLFTAFVILLICFTAGKPETASNSALIIIDVQKAFASPEGKNPVCREQADSIISPINKLVDAFSAKGIDVIYISQSWPTQSELDSRLKVKGNLKFTKTSFSFFSSKDFKQYLESKKIRKLYITGLAAEGCVSSSIGDAIYEGYSVTAISDCIATAFCFSIRNMLENWKAIGVEIIDSNALEKQI